MQLLEYLLEGYLTIGSMLAYLPTTVSEMQAVQTKIMVKKESMHKKTTLETIKNI